MAAMLYHIVGQQDWVGRSIAASFGIWGIFALYQLVRRVWDEEHALVSAAVMAILPGSIFIERSFLPDPAMVALVTTSLWFAVAYCQSDRPRYLVLAGVFGTWGFLSKIPGLIVGIPALYAIWVILGRRQQRSPKKLLLIAGAAVASLIPVIAYYLWARHLSLSYPPYHFAGSGNWVWDSGLAKWLKHSYFIPHLNAQFNNWIWTAPVILLVAVGLCFPPPRRQEDKESGLNSTPHAPWLFHWWLLGGLAYYAIGAKELVTNPWNFHLINPVAAAFAAHGMIAIASSWNSSLRTPRALAIIVVFLLVIGGFGQSSLERMYRPYADQSRKLGLALDRVARPDDLVVTIATDIGDPIAIYYSRRRGWTFPPANNVGWNELPKNDDDAIQLFEELRESGADWFGVSARQTNNLWKNYSKLAQHIERTCQFHSQSKDWLIYRILSPEELKQRSLINS
nr:glycosyltransferase family 39 protein [Oscillatoria sp. FACHB-1406]